MRECMAWLFEMAKEHGMTIKCMWCGDVITALNPCDRDECREQTGRMAEASARLDASFAANPLPLALQPEGMWRMRVRDWMDEAEAMSGDR